MAQNYKRSKVNLWNTLGDKKFSVNQSDGVSTKIEVPDYLDLTGKLELSGRTDNVLYNHLDVGRQVHDNRAKGESNEGAIQNNATAIAGNTTQIGVNATTIASEASELDAVQADVGVLDGKVAAVEADLLGANAELANLDAQVLQLQATDVTQASQISAIQAVNNTQNTEIVNLTNSIVSGDANLQSQIDALGVTDTATLAQINQMLVDYQTADSSTATQISLLEARVSTLEQVVNTLTI